MRQNERSATAAHPRYLSSPAGATLHGKTQGFVPKLSPKTKPMQHPCSHYNAFRNIRSQTRLSLRTKQHNRATFMQPCHCDLQPKIPNHPITATHKHAQSTLKPHQQCGTNHTSKRSYPHPQHTRGTFHRRPEPLYTEKHKVSCPNYLPKRSPCNIHAATTMRFATSGRKPASPYAQSNTTGQHSCSHATAICNPRFQITL